MLKTHVYDADCSEDKIVWKDKTGNILKPGDIVKSDKYTNKVVEYNNSLYLEDDPVLWPLDSLCFNDTIETVEDEDGKQVKNVVIATLEDYELVKEDK